MQAGRARWKIENEHNHTLNPQGSHREHPYGQGHQHLAAVCLTLHLGAFLFHPVLGWTDDQSHVVRQALAARQPFLQNLQALTRDLRFDSWDHRLDFRLQGLEIKVPPHPS